MKVLVIGGACREHAIVHALSKDKKVSAIYTLPERKSLKETADIPSSFLQDKEALIAYLKKESIELVVIGPEQPLVEGLSDFLRDRGLKVFGPSSQAARLEGSKIFAKQFMKEQGIPTASYHIVSSVSEALTLSENFFPPFVLKADGLAGGKGVFLCQNKTELEEKCRLLFEDKVLGSAGEQAILEDFQSGREISVFVLTNGESYNLLPVAQDYKRLYDRQEGPNTGGMGSVAPIPMPPELISSIENLIVEPTLQALKKQNQMYYGVLYLGLMIHKNQAKVLEYNVRFGDPEAQVLLPLLEGSWADIFYKTACGQPVNLRWKNLHSACVVLCSKNYPEGPMEEAPIEGSIYHKTLDCWFLHGAIKKKETKWFTAGGRVLNSVALGKSKEEAVQKAYENIEKISWPGMHYRKDIGII